MWSPRSSLSDESGIEVDEGLATPVSHQQASRAQAVASWLAGQAEVAGQGMENCHKTVRKASTLPIFSSHPNPLRWPESSVENSPASLRRRSQADRLTTSDFGSNDRLPRRPFIKSGDVSLSDASLYGSLPSLVDTRPTPILPQSAAIVEMNGTSLRRGQSPRYNYTVLQDYSGSTVDLTKNTIDVLKGELVSVVHIDNGWAYVVTMDHYCGYIPASYLSQVVQPVSSSQTTQEERNHAKNRLVALGTGSESKSPGKSKPASKEGPATQMSRMFSPSPSALSSSTVTPADHCQPKCTDQGTLDSNTPEHSQDGFWTASPNINTRKVHKSTRRRTRIQEWKPLHKDSRAAADTNAAPPAVPSKQSKTPVLNRSGAFQRTASSPVVHLQEWDVASQALQPMKPPPIPPHGRKDAPKCSTPADDSMRQLETPPAVENSWYSVGISPPTPAEPFSRCQGEDVVCLYDFTPEDENDLSIVSGEELTVLNQSDGSWIWVSNSKNEQGFVPASYVRHVAEDCRRKLPSPGKFVRLQGCY